MGLGICKYYLGLIWSLQRVRLGGHIPSLVGLNIFTYSGPKDTSIDYLPTHCYNR